MIMINMLLFYMFMFTLFVFIMFLYFFINKMVIYMEFEMVKILSMKVEFLILLDWMSLLFVSCVLMISSMVIIYSMEYMESDPYISRFLILVMMFVLSMVLMILSPNLISILMGWDGLGLVSYCLVIYYQSKNSFNSGMVTVLSNRVGDILILMSISLLIFYGSWNYMFFESLSNLVGMMLILASFTKSSQVPFSSWLPMAMAAPTPVSSLVHSSTLVTAGVYLLIRLNILMLSDMLMNFMMIISVLTMFLAGLGASFEFDLKKIIALSTLSQLGVMIFCLSLKFSEVSFFHLVTHAMFKSLLFMCAGVIIHNMLGSQDIRCISMITLNMPLVSLMFNCSTLSLCGIPFLSGFFSKDLIMEMFMMNLFNKFILIFLFMSMGLTVMYSFRLIYYSFIKIPQVMLFVNNNLCSSKMLLSMYLLFFFSIIKGLMLSWILFSMKNLIYLTLKFKLLIYLFMMLGVLLGITSMNFFMKYHYLLHCNNLIKFFSLLWFMPLLYGSWIFKVLSFSTDLIFFMEMGWIEYILGGYMAKFLEYMFSLDMFYKNYFFLMILFIALIIFVMIF